jgi:4-hydroxybenzoate polyprenyltransferase
LSHFKKISDFILKSQLFVALCASLLSAETFFISGTAISWITLTIVFFATLFIYNASLLNVAINRHQIRFKKVIKIEGLPLNLGICLGSVILIFVVLTRCTLAEVLIFTGTALLSLFYMMPFSWDEKRLKGLRNSLFIKNIALSLIWASATVLLPLAGIKNWEWGTELSFMFVRRFFFIYALTIIYDVRDVKPDERNGMQTVALKFGIPQTKVWALTSILIFTFFVFTDPFLKSQAMNSLATALYLSAAVSAFIILATDSKKNNSYYAFVVDGAMAIQFLLVLIFSLSR